MSCLTTPRPIFNDLMTFLADTHGAQLLIRAHGAALMCHARRLAAFGADQHCVGDVERHRLLDDSALASLALRLDVFLGNVQALDNYLADLWQCARNRSLLALIFASDDQDGIALLDIHLGEMKRLFFFLFRCHVFPLLLAFVFVVLAERQTSTQTTKPTWAGSCQPL